MYPNMDFEGCTGCHHGHQQQTAADAKPAKQLVWTANGKMVIDGQKFKTFPAPK